MIYTCTLNPSIDYVMHVADFQSGELNRSSQTSFYPGGKGINVSRLLQRLGTENTALGFVGGFTGDFIKTALENEAINHSFVAIDHPTRVNVKLKSNEESEINGPGAPITKQQQDQLFNQMKQLEKEDFLVASGSAPSSLPDNFYSILVDLCNEKGVHVAADTSSHSLKGLIGRQLFLIKPNHHELGELFQTTIKAKDDAVYYAQKLHQQGAAHVIVSMGGAGAVYVGQDKALSATVPKGEVKNSVGAGDSMVAGFLSSYLKTGNTETAFQYAVAAGSATAFSDDLCQQNEVNSLVDQIKITSIPQGRSQKS